jgi:photosystem II stability/assembly factor-like uncharacterized protein
LWWFEKQTHSRRLVNSAATSEKDSRMVKIIHAHSLTESQASSAGFCEWLSPELLVCIVRKPIIGEMEDGNCKTWKSRTIDSDSQSFSSLFAEGSREESAGKDRLQAYITRLSH